MITKASAIYGMGDALNMRAFLVTYCEQKKIDRSKISIYCPKHWWMFEGMGFTRDTNVYNFGNLTPHNNFGNYDLEKRFRVPKLDKNIALNAGIDFSFDTIVPLPHYTPPKINLPDKYITFNTGFGEFSGKVGDKNYICLKSWPYWEEFVKKIDIPCVQIGAGKSCEIIKGAINLVDKLTIQESAEVMRRGLFHIDMEGGLPILNQHLGKKSVVLFGATAIENQGRSFNLNLRSNACSPCYEWGDNKHKRLYYNKKELDCDIECMKALKPDYVIEKIKGWLC